MAIAQTSLQTLMKKEMTRKEFLSCLGLAALVILNIEPLLRMLGKSSPRHVSTDSGYDGGVYAGKRSKPTA
jgi:hypothetical protein